jgi:hypothetical protein
MGSDLFFTELNRVKFSKEEIGCWTTTISTGGA